MGGLNDLKVFSILKDSVSKSAQPAVGVHQLVLVWPCSSYQMVLNDTVLLADICVV